MSYPLCVLPNFLDQQWEPGQHDCMYTCRAILDFTTLEANLISKSPCFVYSTSKAATPQNRIHQQGIKNVKPHTKPLYLFPA